MTNEIEKLTTDLATRAAGILVTDQLSADWATEIIHAGKGLIRKIQLFYETRKKKAHELWKLECDEEKIDIAKIEPVIDKLNQGVSNWRAEEQRKRDTAEAEARRAEEKRRWLEEEVLRKVKEAEEKAERERQRLERLAEQLRREAAKKPDDEAAMRRIEEEREKLRLRAAENQRRVEEATNRAIDKAAKAESKMAPASIIPEAPKTEGLAMRDNWCFEVVDPAAVPEEYKIIDEVKLGKAIRMVWGQIHVPGVRIFNKPYMAEIGKRTKA